MTAKEYCTSHDAIAYYSGLSGLEIHGIEYGVDDYVYCASGAWVGKYIVTAYARTRASRTAASNKTRIVGKSDLRRHTRSRRRKQ